MLIQIDGVGTVNKGAELLLFAILQEIEARCPSAIVIYNDATFMESNQQPPYFHSNLKIVKPYYMKPCFTWLLRHFRVFGVFERFFPQLNLLKILKSFSSSHVDVVLNAAGFLFSDKFNLGQTYADNLESFFRKIKDQHARIIYLPQAFGPIEKEGTKASVKVLNQYADLVFAREKVSYEYLVRDGFNTEKLYQYPDFTSLVKGTFPSQYSHLKSQVCLIPNMKMVEKGIASYDDYIHFWSIIIETIQNYNKKAFLLNHEGIGDMKICNELSKRCNIPMVSDLNALDTKGIISESLMVVSSRFHGVASSLSSGVPCLATSWSHKYQLLFEDYEQDDCILDVSDLLGCKERVSRLLDESENQNRRSFLRIQADNNKLASRNMWNVVWKKIEE